jgi:hypothetical protein
MKTTPIKPAKQLLIKSPWPGDRSRVHPKLLPVQFGDGKRSALVSFFHCPELVLLVRYDSSLPLDLPDSERFKPNPPPSFRDLTEQIWTIAEETIKARRSWNAIREGGCTWCHA